MRNDKKKRGGWRNPVSAANGRTSTNGGRPRVYASFKRGETLLIERTPLAPGPDNPFFPPELGTVLSVGDGEIEVQIGDSMLVLRRPDAGEGAE